MKLNTNLSQTLQEYKEQLNSLKTKKVIGREQNNKSVISGNDAAARLVSSPALVKYRRQRTDAQVRNVTDYSMGKKEKHDKKFEDGSFKIVQDEPKIMLKKGKNLTEEKVEELKSTSSNPTDKEHSFGDHLNQVEMDGKGNSEVHPELKNKEAHSPANAEDACKN